MLLMYRRSWRGVRPRRSARSVMSNGCVPLNSSGQDWFADLRFEREISDWMIDSKSKPPANSSR
jgi:hypothetical protein